MTDRVSVGNLRVARVLYDFINAELCPAPISTPTASGPASTRSSPTFSRKTRICWRAATIAGADRQVAPASCHRAIDPETYRQFLTEIGYLLPEPADFTIPLRVVDAEITTTGRPAAGGAGSQRAVRAERRQRPLGRSV